MRRTDDGKLLLKGLGAAIRHRRERLKLTQGELAIEAGVHINVVGRTERGIFNPTVLTLQAISEALGVPLARLLREARKPATPQAAG